MKVVIKGHQTSKAGWQIGVALKNPRLAISYLMRSYNFKKALNISEDQLRSYYRELDQRAIISDISGKLSQYSNHKLGHLSRMIELYVIVRMQKPAIMVETGVANGASSRMILEGMKVNGFGKLWSIDYPVESDLIPPDKEAGWLVDNRELRDNWQLIIGDSLKELPPLLQKLGKIDIFMHDSNHTYDHMMSEYKIAHPHVSSGGLILSDDVYRNHAFFDFAKEIGSRPHTVSNLGIIRV